jgi:hypothetical protein
LLRDVELRVQNEILDFAHLWSYEVYSNWLAFQRTADLLSCLFDWTVGLYRDVGIGDIGCQLTCKSMPLLVEDTDSQRVDILFLDSSEEVECFFNFPPPLKSTGGRRTDKLPGGFLLVFLEVDDQLLAIQWLNFDNLAEQKGSFRLNHFLECFERQLPVLGEDSCIGDGLMSFQHQKPLIGEYEGSLLLGENGVGKLYASEVLGEGLLLHELNNLRTFGG